MGIVRTRLRKQRARPAVNWVRAACSTRRALSEHGGAGLFTNEKRGIFGHCTMMTTTNLYTTSEKKSVLRHGPTVRRMAGRRLLYYVLVVLIVVSMHVIHWWTPETLADLLPPLSRD